MAAVSTLADAASTHLDGLELTRGAAFAYATERRHKDAFLVFAHLRHQTGSETWPRSALIDVAAVTEFGMFALDHVYATGQPFPESHAILGEALMILGDLRNSAASAVLLSYQKGM